MHLQDSEELGANDSSKKTWIVFLIGLTLSICGCSMLSGNRPIAVTPTDREVIKLAEERLNFNVPLITHPIDNRPVKIFKIAFDGTMNDASRVPETERPTAVAQIAKRINAHYYPGPGMQNKNFVNWLDGALGFTSREIASRGKRDFLVQASKWLDEDPTVEIRIFVTGFSRGSAIARHFMNIVEQEWPTPYGRRNRENTPHFYALLFDTVATGQMDTLQLSLPTSLDYLVHMVAKDEPRSMYIPVIDKTDENDTLSVPINETQKDISPRRINFLLLPGAHSDIGAAYSIGIGDIYRDMSEQLLSKLGLINQNCWESSDDPFVNGKHDSRGNLDILMGRSAPNRDESKERPFYSISPAQLHADQESRISARLNLLSLANGERFASITKIWTRSESITFDLLRNGTAITVIGYSPAGIDPNSIKYYVKDDIRHLDFKYFSQYSERISHLIISDEIWKKLPEGEPITLSYNTLKKSGQMYLETHLDDKLVASVATNKGESTLFNSGSYRCKTNSLGETMSPIQMYIFSIDK